jgi:hypothetical protein
MKSKLIILTLLGVFLFNSCEEYLKEDIYSQITPELLFTSGDNAQLAVNAIYARYFDEWGTYRALVFALGMQVNQEFTFQRPNGNSDLQWNSSNGQLGSIWRGLYNGINTANVAIDGIGKMEVSNAFSEEKKNQLIAEARFMRAHGYYHLLRYWGGVPIQDKPTANPEEAIKAKDSHQAVFEFIVEDLKFAQQYLPVSYTGGFPDSGNATKGAAVAQLAMVYAQVSGVQFEGKIDKDYWNEARAELVKLIDVNNPKTAASPFTYSMEPDFKDLFWGGERVGGTWQPTRTANDLGREIIWAANFDPGAFANHGTWYFNHWARGLSPYVVGKFEEGDYRDEISLDRTTYEAQDRVVSAKIKRNQTGNTNYNNVYFARYAGMILLLAEVENEINGGPTDLALNCINAVRERARGGLDGAETRAVPADISTGLSYNDFKDTVFDERAVELAVEFQFWPDILRSGRLQRDWANLGSGADGDRGSYDARWNFWPVPLNEIVTSGGIIEQNSGH